MENFLSSNKDVSPNWNWDSLDSVFLNNFSKITFIKFLRKTFLSLLFIGSCFSSIHAFDTTSLKVWIDFIEEGDYVFVKGLAISLKENSNEYTWEMDIHKETSEKHSDKKLKGKYIAKPYYPHIISETEINIKKKEYFVITLSVFDAQKNMLGSDTLFSTEVNPELIRPPAPPKPIVKRIQPNPKQQNQNQNLDALEIDGLILDETRSKIGRDFYELFYNRWIPPNGVKDFLITIRELPGRGLGATVSIEVNDNIVLNRSLMPRGGAVEEQVGITISYLKGYLRNLEDLKKDLDANDSQGNGIF